MLSPHARLYTEMVTAAALIHGDAEKLLRFNSAERPVALQLGGSDLRMMADAAAHGVLDLIATVNALPADAFDNRNGQNALTNKLLAVLRMIDRGNCRGALEELTNDVLSKTDGCAIGGTPDSNDWIISCPAQSTIYPLVLAEIKLLRLLI